MPETRYDLREQVNHISSSRARGGPWGSPDEKNRASSVADAGTPQGGFLGPQGALRGPREAPKMVQKGSESPTDRTKTPNIASRWPQAPPSRPKRPPRSVSRGPREAKLIDPLSFLKDLGVLTCSASRRSKTAQEAPIIVPGRPKRLQRGPRDGPIGFQDVPRWPQDDPKREPRRGTRRDISSPRPQEEPRRPQEAPKRPHEAPKRPSRGPKRTPRGLQRGPQRTSKRAPNGPNASDGAIRAGGMGEALK